MRLLIITQKADKNDPILGFFHRWIEEFAKHCESVIVVCLEEGEHDLPENVRVLSLGKEGGQSRLKYLWRFYKYIWRERKDYDSVFVHMNQVYVLLGFPIWKSLGKRVGLWYTHKSVPVSLKAAAFLTDVIFSASPESFRVRTSKLKIVGHGIDTEFFSPDPNVSRGNHWLSVGRLSPIKRHDVAIREVAKTGVSLRVAGDGEERGKLEALVRELNADVSFLGPLNQDELRDEYRSSAKLIHRSETGSLDKVVLEAAACSCPVDSSDSAIRRLPLLPEYVAEHHSLQTLILRILEKVNN